MRRSGWYATIVVALGAGLLPGCLPFLRTNSPGPDEKGKAQRPGNDLPPRMTDPPNPPLSTQRIDVLPPPELQQIPVVPPTQTQEPFVPPTPPDKGTKVTPALPVANKVDPPAPPDPDVVVALNRLIEHRPAEAKEILGRYGKLNQDSLWQVLNIAGRLHEKGLDGLTPQELCTIQESLKAFGLVVQARAPLHVSRMFFFESGRPGEYPPLRAGHVFRAGHRDRPGELVQVHVEFRNLACEERRDGSYQTDLLCSVEISDPNDKSGQPIWKKDLDYGKKTLLSQVPRTEYAINYTFYMPPLPAGNLVLTLTVQDLTRPDHPRVARRSLEFCVNNLAERAPQAP